jgi:hypothetical protein
MGRNKEGQASDRCLDNTGDRRWLVIEFDFGSIIEQGALHKALSMVKSASGYPELRLVVWSGGKSLHGWYGPCQDEAVTRAFFAIACMYGADPVGWVRCQLFRLPMGKRKRPEPVALPPGWCEDEEFTTQDVVFWKNK